MAIGGAIAVAFFYFRSRDIAAKSQQIKLDNPFELSQALKWGVVFTVVIFLAKLATELLGQTGSYVAGLLAGASDVDAITLSMASLAKTDAIDSKVAVTTIMLGTASNTIVKGVMASVIGGWKFGRLVLGAFGLLLLGGAVGVGALWVAS